MERHLDRIGLVSLSSSNISNLGPLYSSHSSSLSVDFTTSHSTFSLPTLSISTPVLLLNSSLQVMIRTASEHRTRKNKVHYEFQLLQNGGPSASTPELNAVFISADIFCCIHAQNTILEKARCVICISINTSETLGNGLREGNWLQYIHTSRVPTYL